MIDYERAYAPRYHDYRVAHIERNLSNFAGCFVEIWLKKYHDDVFKLEILHFHSDKDDYIKNWETYLFSTKEHLDEFLNGLIKKCKSYRQRA